MSNKKDQKMSIKLGDVVRDKISGFSGIVVCKTEWLYGCIRYGVAPKELYEGKRIEADYFDEPQLELIEVSSGSGIPLQTGGGREKEKKAISR